MKIITLIIFCCIAALGSKAQKFTPKTFLEIIKENKPQHKFYPALPPAINNKPQTIITIPAVVYAPIDHMPVLMLSADESLYNMPVLKMLPNGYPLIKSRR